jgi:RNA polymerase sigma factor (sigma-70 family)
MSPFDPKRPLKPEATTPKPEATTPSPEPASATGGGVRVVVHDRPARPEAPKEREPPRRGTPDVVIIPEDQLLKERNAFVASLDERWKGFILKELSRRDDVAAASRQDVCQAVLIILGNHYVKERRAGRDCELENEPAFLDQVITHAAMNHATKKQRRLEVELGVELDEEPDSGLDPERALLLAERRARIARGLAELPKPEAEVFEARAGDRLTFELIATLLKRPLSTVHNQYARAVEKLRHCADAPERGPALAGGPAARPAADGPTPARRKPDRTFRK